MTRYHVATTGADDAEGTADAPLRTVSRAAALARPGDTVTVHAGEYREWVRPARGGRSDTRRITYEAAPGEHVVIKGSERITGWTRADLGGTGAGTGAGTGTGTGTVRTVTVPAGLFGDFNPFAHEVDGDWLLHPPTGERAHLGEVYLDGRSLYEVHDRAAVVDPPRRTTAVDQWTGRQQPLPDPDATRRVWYAEVGRAATTIWANFGDVDPGDAIVEINVRRSVFYPDEHHLDYITVRGFELAQAATPWAPPTADQPGLVGPNWARGWVIEDCFIHDAKCSAVSLGKEASTGHNLSTQRGDKPGYQYQLEAVFAARQIGWDREHVGSHVVRRNTITDCGQNAVVGHLGAVFSTIEDNHVARIGTRRQFVGYEIAGIKLHAAIDVEIRGNHVHDCTLGIWLDWQTQGTRVTRNVLHDNTRDLFVEVSHGPYVVDHNVLASAVAVEVFSQGGAFVHNLVGGAVRLEAVLDRATPYHRPHSTQVAGYAVVYGGDDRWVGNLFLGGDATSAYVPGTAGYGPVDVGTAGYDGCPATFDEYLAGLGPGDHVRFHGHRQPAYVHHNVYANSARPYEQERGAVVLPGPVAWGLVVDDGAVHLELDLPEAAVAPVLDVVTGADLPPVRFVGADFEAPDGSPVVLGTDLRGDARTAGTAYPAGPLVALPAGPTRVRIR
ncbi:right-handed parallel beta-helix repeat-containing protein [Cellulomonas marina]|uniref:Right handed beta helix region n=1 Tax=Cellulomonas marina TaxID=988821 RepID=A0A1I0VBS7_9CELL|nr:right-handed parallel beta-helix repeat-containing protein [Cellulomonas marina]GIG29160.1 hypothetical protein Cma02nite_17600 [Cellulomonas marina]SFA73712.1 Protein of unknown function [Cellulomonas marina]